MPYRVDIAGPPADAMERLVELGALDVEETGSGIAAIVPDGVTVDTVAREMGAAGVAVSEAVGRDDASVWLLSPRAVQVGRITIAPPGIAAPADALRIADSQAFGTGQHATTALCIEALAEILAVERVERVLDVGTGSGILALAALKLGAARAAGVDIDAGALEAAAENARLNGMDDRLDLIRGGPEAVQGNWPLIVANVLAGPLMEMAPALVERLGSRGRLVLSGIRESQEEEVRRAYRHFGVRHLESRARDGWTVLIEEASW